jgi:hypothetical protein
VACYGLIFAAMLGAAGATEYADLPSAVVLTLADVAPTIEIDEIEAEGDPTTEFEIEGWLDDSSSSRVEITIATDGQLLSFELDSDEDGIGDDTERANGTSPDDHDSDDDLFPDGFEIEHGGDPMDPTIQPEILSITTRRDAEGVTLLVSVQTFTTGMFQLEHCEDTVTWEAVGELETGDGEIVVFEFPLPEGCNCGLFRVSVTPDEADGGGGDDSKVPVVFTGLDIVMAREDETRTLCFNTASRGTLIEREDDEVEIIPFNYTVEKIDECTTLITITFPGDDEGDEHEEFELHFTSTGGGTYRSQDFEDGKGEDPETGDFSTVEH